jgi:alpha-L-rhamnosidase
MRALAALALDDPGIEPWAYLNHGGPTGAPVPLSPDPLVGYEWWPSVNATALQCYDVLPVAVTVLANGAAFGELASLTTATPRVTVSGAGSFMVDIGTESAAWLEFDSPNLAPGDLHLVQLGISEWAEPLKQGVPVAYGSGCGGGGSTCTYRLETNSELYEGVRYAFFTTAAAPSAPFTITAMRAVSQVCACVRGACGCVYWFV